MVFLAFPSAMFVDTASMAHGTNQLFFNSENAMNSNPIGNYQHLEDHIPSTIWGSNTPSAEPDYPLHNADPSQPSALTSTQTSTPGFYPNAASEPGNTDYLNTSNTSYNENYPDPSQDRNDEENDYDNEIFRMLFDEPLICTSSRIMACSRLSRRCHGRQSQEGMHSHRSQ